LKFKIEDVMKGAKAGALRLILGTFYLKNESSLKTLFGSNLGHEKDFTGKLVFNF